MRVVERILERAAPSVPGSQQRFVAPPPEQPRVVPARQLGQPLAHLGDHLFVSVPDSPAAVRKPLPRVLFRAAWSLHHTVQGHPIHHDYLAHLALLSVVTAPLSCAALGSETRMIPSF